jgi:hypothetical protein
MTILRPLALFAAAAALAACARQLPADTQAYVKGVQASAAYHTGFTDGCATADLNHDMQKQRRNEDSFQNDPEYRLGWVAGTENCHDTVFTPSTGNPNHTHPIF